MGESAVLARDSFSGALFFLLAVKCGSNKKNGPASRSCRFLSLFRFLFLTLLLASHSSLSLSLSLYDLLSLSTSVLLLLRPSESPAAHPQKKSTDVLNSHRTAHHVRGEVTGKPLRCTEHTHTHTHTLTPTHMFSPVLFTLAADISRQQHSSDNKKAQVSPTPPPIPRSFPRLFVRPPPPNFLPPPAGWDEFTQCQP